MTKIPKMIFLDLDGTLMDDDKNIPAYNMTAIRKALQQGHKVIICTGRPLCSAKNCSLCWTWNEKAAMQLHLTVD